MYVLSAISYALSAISTETEVVFDHTLPDTPPDTTMI